MSQSLTDHRRLAAIMFTDMVGYSALSQRNEALALELLEEHRRIVRDILPRHGGREVKTTGDGFLVEFASALAAVRCAVEIQQALAERNQSQPAERQVRIRIGIHLGDVVRSAGDVHGDGVNIAARLEPLAEPGGICVSEDVARQIRNKLPHPLASLGPAELKNIELPVVVHRVVLPWLPGGRVPARPTGSAAQAPRRRPTLLVGSASVVAVALLLVGAAWWLRNHRPADADRGAIRSLAVGLNSGSPDRDQQAWARVMTELLVSYLSRIESLTVLQLPPPKDHEDAAQAALEQGRRLNVTAVVRGTVHSASNEVLIIPALVEVASGRVLWSDPHRRRLGEVPGLQEELAREIAKEIRLTLTPTDKARLAQRSTESPEAMKAYLQGRANWVRGDQAGYSNSIVLFQQAIALDPNFALAYAGLADAWTAGSITHVPPAQAYPQAKAAARKALELQEDLPDAQVALGMAVLFSDWDWRQAERHLTRAIELAPDLAQARFAYSCFLAAAGRLDDSVRQGMEAVRRNPLAPDYLLDVSMYYLAKGDFSNAWAQTQAALELDRSNPMVHLNVGWIHMTARRYGEAEQSFREALRLQPDDPLSLGSLGASLAAQGRRAEALEVVKRLDELGKIRYVAADQAVATFAHLGDFGEAFGRLERAVRQKESSVLWMRVDPGLIPLRSDPRFEALARRIGIPP
jgi:class 3 adenylate cyclase/tetratricopeptide (TPR) repeat protein